MNARWIRRSRRLLLIAACLPVLQVSVCQTATNQALASIANQLPGIIFNSYFNALLQTFLGLFGSGLDLFGGSGLGGDGTGGTGFGGGF